MEQHGRTDPQHGGDEGHNFRKYLRFGAMIATAMVVMYAVMFVGSWEWSHVRPSASRAFMAMTMAGTMGLIMLAWMLNMYRNTTANMIVVIASLALFGVGAFLDRSQVTVGDVAFQNAMIPHHSLAITRSERARLEDVRVCELAVEISAAQRREILEMSWLVEDIRTNGIAASAEEAAARPVPEFDRPANRSCPTG